MGKASDYVIDYNKLNGGGDSVKGLHFGETIQQAYLGGTLVFNRAQYSIEAFDVLLTASGTTNLKDTALVDSIKTDRGGMQSVVGYTISPASIPANETSGELTGEYTVTQKVSGLSAKGKWTQGGDSVVGYTYSGLKVTSVSYAYVPAGGGFVVPVVAYSGTRTTVYASGKKVSATWGSNTTSLLSATGKALVTGASFHTVGDLGKVYAPSLGTTLSDSRAVAQITSLSIKAVDGSTLSWTGTVTVYQAANAVTKTTYGAYTLTLSASAATVVALGGTVTLSVVCSQAATYTYTSGSSKDVTLNGVAALSTSRGSLSITSVTGSGSSILTIPENTGAARSVTVTAIAGDGTTQKTATVSQAAVAYGFYSNTLGAIGASGGSLALQLISTRNGKDFAVGKSNVAVSGLSGASVSSVTAVSGGDTGEYSVIVDVPANTSTSSRDFTVTATQPTSGLTYVWEVTQSGIAVTKKKAFFAGTFTFGLNLSTGAVNYGFISVSNSVMSAIGEGYTGGTLSSLQFRLVKADGTVLVTKDIGNVTVSDESTSAVSLLSLSNSSGSADVVVQVRYDGSLQQTCGVMIPSVS